MTIRKIQPTDSPAMAAIIRTVMPEFGANRPGFALFDKAVDNIHAAYDRPQCTCSRHYPREVLNR